ncbi:hypothetical protein FBU59_007132, partial [Linderina macrospora]
GGNILKRMSVHQKSRHTGTRGMAEGIEEDVDGEEDADMAYRMSPLQRAASRASIRSSIYYLDDGTLEPYTGYAFAQEEENVRGRKQKGNKLRKSRS